MIRLRAHWCLLTLLVSGAVTATPGGQAPASEALTLRIIVVESAEDARQVEARLAAGEDFAALARALSVDASAASGGLLGLVRVSSLRPELREALRAVGAGRTSRAVRIPLGLAIVQVVPNVAGASVVPAPPGLAAEGSVKYLIDVGGFAAAVTVARLFASPDTWQQSRTACELRAKATTRSVDALRRELGAVTPSQPGDPEKTIQRLFIAGQLFAYEGRMDESIREFQRAYDIARHQPGALVDELEEPLGIAYLHRAEMTNGLYHKPGDRCLLSERGLAALAQTADLDRAMAHLTRHLAAKPGDLEGRWLLNLAAMMAGRHPRAVPAAHLIPTSVFGSAEDVGRFRDVAGAAGLQAFAAAGGLVVDDFDGDGRLDVVTSTMDPCGSMRFFHAEGDGRFTDRTTAAGLGDELGSLNILHADYDNDGDVDLLALRGGWEVAQRKSLLRNDGRGVFTNVTSVSGLAATVTSTQTAVWADYDNDGLLDLFVGNEESEAQLFRNKGDGAFAEVSVSAGVHRSSFAKGVAAGDYDGDGWVDLYVSNLGGRNFLYRNTRDGRFVETAQAAGVTGPGRSFATWFFDYDNDGWPDLFVASYFTSLDETARTYLKLPHNARTLMLYRNLGNSRFEDVTVATGLDKVFMPMGSNFGDLDNDGFLDIYLGTGNPSYGSLVPSVLLRNRGGRAFVDVTSSSGTGELHKGHGVAFADLDDDGDDELLFEVGGATPGDRHAMRLFENPGHGNAWIDLKLTGTRSNRGAMGARIKVIVRQSNGAAREVHRVVTTGGSFGGSPLRQHVGLGPGTRTVDVEVSWPASGTVQRFANVAANERYAITEGSDALVRLERRPVRLGGPAAQAATRQQVTGMVVSVDARRTGFVVSHDAIPGVMAAMTMPFDVRDRKELEGVSPGAMVEFTLIADAAGAHAERVVVKRYQTVEQDPLTARRLTLLRQSGAALPGLLAEREMVPDFSLVDQARRPTRLSQLRGKVVAVNFIYTSCPLPQFCFRIANHFGVLQRRFASRLGTDLVLLTITFDPARDQPEVLAEYAHQWKADPATWKFLSGPVSEIARVTGLFGVQFYPDEGLMNHSLHTAVIGRDGRLAANIEGNLYTSAQLGDLVQSILAR